MSVVIAGAGMGGLVAAAILAADGLDVTVCERGPKPGGKLRQIELGGLGIDAGPTVFTLKPILDSIFAAAGESFDDCVATRPATTLARHAWDAGETLDLFASVERSADAIGDFAGAAEARGYRAFCADAGRIWRTLETPFVRAATPDMIGLIRGARLADLIAIRPFTTLWSALGSYFADPRLRQLFGRYATYCGSSPFAAPATLMLVAHVEQEGVWLVEGGMVRLAEALAALAVRRGARFRYGAEVTGLRQANGALCGVRLADGEEIACASVIFNGDAAALARAGMLPGSVKPPQGATVRTRSLSAMTWAMRADTDGFALSRHNVFFSRDYPAEFEAIFRDGAVPAEPTVYVCAQDRDGDGGESPGGEPSGGRLSAERLLCLINAPAIGDRHAFTPQEVESCRARMQATLSRCGLRFDEATLQAQATTPQDFEALFPMTGGALYGQASHGWSASFSRPAARTRLPGLYLAGGSVHPGPGLPMAALSGLAAARSLLADRASRRRFRGAAMPGGMSMR